MVSVCRISVCLAVILAVGLCTDIGGKGTAKGKFDYNSAQCKWNEKRETRSLRSLNIQCGGNNGFSTSYEGDPHKCNWYKDGNQVKYYECLVSALKKANFCKNSPSQVVCDKKNCGDVVFKKSGERVDTESLEFSEMTIEEDPEWNDFDPLDDLY